VSPTVLDTDVASLLHRGTLVGPLATRIIGREPLITFVTFGELAKWAEIRNWGPAPPRGTHHLAVPHCGIAWRRGGSRDLGAAVRGSRPARATAAGQRHVDCGLLPHSWHPARHLEPQGLRGLQPAPRLAYPRPGIAGVRRSRGRRRARLPAAERPARRGPALAGVHLVPAVDALRQVAWHRLPLASRRRQARTPARYRRRGARMAGARERPGHRLRGTPKHSARTGAASARIRGDSLLRPALPHGGPGGTAGTPGRHHRPRCRPAAAHGRLDRAVDRQHGHLG
jgi:hypothetical protein